MFYYYIIKYFVRQGAKSLYIPSDFCYNRKEIVNFAGANACLYYKMKKEFI